METVTPDTSWPYWLLITTTALSYAFYPVFLILKAVWYMVLLLSAPFIYIGRLTATVSLIPWHIFAQFEVGNIHTCMSNALMSIGTLVFHRQRSLAWSAAWSHLIYYHARLCRGLQARSQATTETDSPERS